MATIGCICGKGGMRDTGEENENEFYAISDKNFWEYHNNTNDFEFKDGFIDNLQYDVWCCPNCGRLIVFDEKTKLCAIVYKPEIVYDESINDKIKESID